MGPLAQLGPRVPARAVGAWWEDRLHCAGWGGKAACTITALGEASDRRTGRAGGAAGGKWGGVWGTYYMLYMCLFMIHIHIHVYFCQVRLYMTIQVCNKNV